MEQVASTQHPATVFLLMASVVFPATTWAATRTVPVDFTTIQAAIDASDVGDTVLVLPGTYRGEGNRGIEFRGRDIVLRSEGGPALTIIDPEQQDRGFFIHEWETSASSIEGFTVQNGYAQFGHGKWPGGGGGIACPGGSPSIVDCWFYYNRADAVGGALDLVVSDSRVRNCIVAGNFANDRGGGINFETGNAAFENCLITGNGAYGGGGLSLANAFGTPISFTNCTISANTCSIVGGGILAYRGVILDRCIVAGNCAGVRHEEISMGPEGLVAICSLIDSTGVGGVGKETPTQYDSDCLFVDPEFCDPALCGIHTQGDWSLQSDSPCAPAQSPCGQLIGALDVGCYVQATGACCLGDLSCVTVTMTNCESLGGTYFGDGVPCDPSPCQPSATQRATWGALKSRFR